MAILSRDQILGAQDIQTETVTIPEWGGDVIMRGLTGKQRDAFESSVMIKPGRDPQLNLRNLRAKLVALCCIDESGARLFSDEDVEALGDKSAAVLDRLFAVAQRLSGLTQRDVEELAKNSVSDQSGNSISG